MIPRTPALGLAALSLSLSLGCGFLPQDASPMVVAHRGAAGNWPENSRTAIQQSVAAGYDAIEIDLVLTSDLVPVLAHENYLNPHRCTYADGSTIPDEPRVYIKDISLADLQNDYLCGGLEDPALPEAEVYADTVMTLDEVLTELAADDSIVLQLDLKYEPGNTQDAETYATEIMGRFFDSGVTNRHYVTTVEPEAVAAFQAAGAIEVDITWPKFPSGENSTVLGLTKEILHSLGFEDPVGYALGLGADGVNIPYQLVDRQTVEAAKAAGLTVQLWTLNSQATLDVYCNWPVDAVITDFPERATACD